MWGYGEGLRFGGNVDVLSLECGDDGCIHFEYAKIQGIVNVNDLF